ncbi:cbb3-type cytochrome oxidase assembly protein CcoS [Paracoccus fistulariae]|uniref:Cbb3-type cytochrome oxidase assembly protein CcoS n=1 Tax=Paracoccus fistulariae TaxID=658446 RepID=A0ABY7SI50_9RHOB|nr:cbb3-type cytochrome oxidase assembly protein CcoS [Paracoccus fistulariae]MDB6182077.1 cbb3-type cytochrome oxidase assembly protein CcoS [Paracoccus fistulariae]WCR06692.1 cbb3-type cytochrome oxidase assembly protein CcoS [Paracoccus fistulariae]
MNILLFLIPVTLLMGAVGLLAFMWSLRSGQYEDLVGDAERILFDGDDTPLPARHRRPDDKETTP